MNKDNWKNRIVKTGEKPAEEFNFNPENWREHPQIQREALDEILEQIGWVQSVIVNSNTQRVIDGHARIEQALKKNKQTLVPFHEVDLTEEEEKKILLLLDPIGSMATVNTEKLQNLADLVGLESSASLEVIADLLTINNIDTLELPKEDSSMGVTMNYLKFGNEKVPITDDELKLLEKKYLEHVEQTGTNYGFVNNLLEV